MKRPCMKSIIVLIALAAASGAIAADNNQPDDIKQMKGISIQGDKEAPKSLYIVPWHDAEHKQSTRMSSSLVEDSLQAIDQNAMKQQLRLHELSTSGWHRLAPDTR